MGPYLQQAIATEDIAGWPVAGNPQAWTHLAHFRQLQDAQQFLLSPSKGEAFYFWPGTLVGHFLRPNSCGWSFDGFLQRWLVASLSGSSGYRSVLDEKRFLFPTEPKEWADVPWESCSSVSFYLRNSCWSLKSCFLTSQSVSLSILCSGSQPHPHPVTRSPVNLCPAAMPCYKVSGCVPRKALVNSLEMHCAGG